MTTKKQPSKEVLIACDRLELDPTKLYYCTCCTMWAHEQDPCDCAYQLCSGKCVSTSEV